jgi:hypothetical protein
MKTKRGGNIQQIENLFADDPAMKKLLTGCNRDKVLSFFSESSMGGGAKGKRGRDEDDEEVALMMEEIPIPMSKRQKRDELEFPDKCSAIQRAVAIFASSVIQLMYSGATTAATCYFFPQQAQALSNIMSGFLSILAQNVGGSGTIAAVGAVGGFIYAYQRDGKTEELISKIFSLAKQPLPGNVLRAIMKRAVTLCENDLVPIGRGMTIDSIKQSFWNKLGEYGLGPVAEARRQERQSELARLSRMYEQRGIPQPPRMGMPSKKVMSTKKTLQEMLREDPRVQALLETDTSDLENIENTRNMIEQVRNELRNVRTRKTRNDEDIANLEGMPELVENIALEEALEQAKVGSEVNAKKIDLLLNKESELLFKLRQLESIPKRLESIASVREEEPSFMISEDEEEVVVEKPKKSKKTKKTEGGKRRSHKKHHKQTKKHSGMKHHKKSRKHHKKTHKKY